MNTKKRSKKTTSKYHHKLTESELKTIAYVATLILAGYLIYSGVQSPAAWGFLGGAIGALFGQSLKSGK